MILSMRYRVTSFVVGLMFACSICLSLSACSQQEPPKVEKNDHHATTFKIGLIPEQDVFAQKKRYAPLLAYLSEKLDISIEISLLPRYGNIIDNFNDLGLDGAFFGSFTGALAIKKLGVEPLARPRYLGGASTYYGMVFVRKGGGIQSARDMRGKQMVFVDRATTAGYLLPLAYFKSLGIENYETWFREYYFSGTHEGAINDVLNGLADIGAAKNTVYYRMAAKDERISKDLEILQTSPLVPANGLAVRPDLENELKQKLKKQLMTMHQNVEGREVLHRLMIEQFIETTVADYQPVLDYASKIGLDLKTYNYLNN